MLSQRQARWAEFLAEFWFKVVYRPGHLNTKADVLSRRWDYADEDGAEAPRSLLKPGQWVAGARSGDAGSDADRQWVVVDSAKIASTKVYTLLLHPASRTQVRTYPRCLIH